MKDESVRYWTRLIGKSLEEMILDTSASLERDSPRRWTERTYWRDVEALLITVMTWSDGQKLAMLREMSAVRVDHS